MAFLPKLRPSRRSVCLFIAFFLVHCYPAPPYLPPIRADLVKTERISDNGRLHDLLFNRTLWITLRRTTLSPAGLLDGNSVSSEGIVPSQYTNGAVRSVKTAPCGGKWRRRTSRGGSADGMAVATEVPTSVTASDLSMDGAVLVEPQPFGVTSTRQMSASTGH
uniref:Secreted protein n=1 Tax=Globodera rostochiensis TaxID=31243 RepID=A0A914HD22_GLORO